MKKFILLFSVLLISTTVFAQDAIYTVKDGTQLKCTGEMVSGSIDEYKNVEDYYTIKNNNIYSKNLINLYGNVNKEPREVLKLKVSPDEITFKDRLYEAWVADYKWVKINRHTGEYTFNAKRDFGTWYRKANVIGKCSIIN